MYSSTRSLTSALDGGWEFNSTLRPLYAQERWLDGPQGRSGRVRKILPPPGVDSQTVKTIVFLLLLLLIIHLF